MYTITIYFDEKTNRTIQNYINQIAKVTGNMYMLDNNVPPHITLSAFDTKNEMAVVELTKRLADRWKQDTLQWVSVGAFFPYVMFIAPVLNEYLQKLSIEVYTNLLEINDISIRKCYTPYQWLPHTTIGKMLEEDDMVKAFKAMHDQFGVIEGRAVRVGVARSNPHMDIAVFDIVHRD